MFVGKRIGTLLKLACSISLDTFFRQNSFLSLIISLASLESIINFFSQMSISRIQSSIRGMLKWKWWNISLAELTCPYAHWAIYACLKKREFRCMLYLFQPKNHILWGTPVNSALLPDEANVFL